MRGYEWRENIREHQFQDVAHTSFKIVVLPSVYNNHEMVKRTFKFIYQEISFAYINILFNLKVSFELNYLFADFCDPSCSNGGTCVAGNCSCASGWSGNRCQTRKYMGSRFSNHTGMVRLFASRGDFS